MEQPKFYFDYAEWWELLSPHSHYDEEAPDIRDMLRIAPDTPPRTVLELGCGGGSVAYHLKHEFQLTLSDLSPGMVGVCRQVNPECEAVVGDMRTLRLGRIFDAVLIHDAICYMRTEADLRAAFATAAAHTRQGGGVVILPDHTKENFVAGTDYGGEDGADGRGLRYLEWTTDPDPSDNTYEVAYAFLLREADGSVRNVLDQHVEGLFSENTWLALLDEAGFDAYAREDDFKRTCFVGRRR